MPASTQTLPANNTDSFVFSMLSQHCDYVSPQLEQAYLDPFVMMLTACAVPVLIRIADILMPAISAGAAVASKRINGSRSSDADDERAPRRAGIQKRLLSYVERKRVHRGSEPD